MEVDLLARKDKPSVVPFLFDKSKGEITAYLDNATEVVIPETIEGHAVRSIGPRAFAKKALTKVSIPATVELIGERAFSWNYIEEVNFAEGIKFIGDSAFAYNSITSIDLPDSVIAVAEEAFYKNNLQSLSIKNPTLEPNPFGELDLVRLKFRDPLYSSGRDRSSLLKTENGLVTAITVSNRGVPEGVHILAPRSVLGSNKMIMNMPSTLKRISDYAFDFVKVDKIVISSDIEYIGKNAFEDVSCDQGLTLVGYKGSYVDHFAQLNGLQFEVIEESAMDKIKSVSSGLLDKIKTSSIFGK